MPSVTLAKLGKIIYNRYMKILEFIGFLIAGFALIYFAYPLANITGRQDWVEKYLGSGGTITFYRLLGLLIVIFGFIFLVNF